MSPITLTARKLLKLSGAAVVGTAVAALFAAPAFAWSATLTPAAKCADNGTVTVTWTVHNKENNWDAHFFVTGGSVTIVVVWPRHGDKPGDHKTVKAAFEGMKCEAPSPSPSKSTGGGE